MRQTELRKNASEPGFQLPVAHARLLSETIVETIRQGILDGTIKPNEHLVEAHIAAQMGVSKSPVREALRMLVNEGLCELRPRRGTFVVEFTEDDIQEIRTLRAALEGLAAELAIEKATDEEILQLEGLLEEASHAIRDPAMLARMHLEFHFALSRLGQHGRIMNILAQYEGQILSFISLTHLMYSDPGQIVRDHQPMLDALKSRSKERMRELMRTHTEVKGEEVTKFVARGRRGEGRPRADGTS